MAELSKEQQTEEAQSNRNRRSSGGLWLGLVAIFFLLCLGGFIFFLDKQHQERQKTLEQSLETELNKKEQQIMELTQQISGYQTQIAAIQSQLANVQQDTTGKSTHFNQALDDFSKLFNEKLELTRSELKNSIDQVQRLLGKTRSDWLIADAEYLMSIANERIQLIGDVTTAKQALESAESRLRESEDAAVYKVREQLAKEIDMLGKVALLDVVGIHAKITALQQAADQLTLFLPYVGKKDAAQAKQPEPASDPSEQNWISSTLKDFKSYVSIRHSSKPVEGIIGSEEVKFIVQQLQVRLEMVKIALLQQNEELYLSSIEETKQWLKDNFTMDARAHDFLKQLEELQAIQIRSQLPEISGSLKLLKDITKVRIDTDKTLPPSPSEPAQTPSNTSPEATTPTPAVTPAPEALQTTTPLPAGQK